MNIKKFIFPALFVGSMLTLINRLFAKQFSKPSPTKPDTYRGSFEAIDTYIQQQMSRLKIPGLSLAIVDGDKIVYQRGFGSARPDGEVPSPQTPFVLGSTAKSITALAVMQLVEAGKVELDAPIQLYLPWFRVADIQASAQITVRHLLNQTSGLPITVGMVNLADLDDDPGAAERQARQLSSVSLSHPVGSTFEYSNLNYNLLGLILEAASGEKYTDYLQYHIFTPLEMRHTYTSQAMAKQDGLAVGHRYWFAQPIAIYDLPLPRGSLPSGQLISSSEDMARYLIAHLNGGRYRDIQVLSSAGIDELHRQVAEQFLLDVPLAGYGMGWFVSKIGQTTIVSHGGNVPDFSSFIAIIPEQKKGVVLLVNADHWGLPIVLPEVGEAVTALLAGEQPPPIRLGFIPWIMRATPLIPLLQIAGIFTTLRLLGRWRREPVRRPTPGRIWGQHIFLPLIPNLSLAAILLYLRSSGLIRYMHLYMPDLSWIVRICGSFAGIWVFLRTGLILQVLRKTRV